MWSSDGNCRGSIENFSFYSKINSVLTESVCNIMTYRFYQGQLRSATSALRKLNISRIALEIQTKSCGFKIERKWIFTGIEVFHLKLRNIFYWFLNVIWIRKLYFIRKLRKSNPHFWPITLKVQPFKVFWTIQFDKRTSNS